MKFRKRSENPAVPRDAEPADSRDETVVIDGPVVSVYPGGNGTTTQLSFGGFSSGGHEGTVRLIGPNGADHLTKIRWGGETYGTLFDGTDWTDVIVKVDGAEYRFTL